MLTDAGIRALLPTSKRQVLSCGNSLFLVIEPVAKGGGKSFIGRLRFPPGRSGLQIEIRIGTYKRSSTAGRWTLKAARDEWERIRAWSKEHRKDPRELLRAEKAPQTTQTIRRDLPTVLKAVDAFYARSKHSPRTIEDYKNKLDNQIIPVLGPDTTLESLEWENGGREKVLKLKQGIEARGALNQSDKVLMVMRMVFDSAIDMGWMKPPNPALASKQAQSGHKSTPNPSLTWQQVPQFFADLQENKVNSAPWMIAAVKVTVISFLRVGSLVPVRWDELDYNEMLWTIPADRMKSKKEHEVPITEELQKIFDSLYKYNGSQDHVFHSNRGGKFPHINPYSINKLIANLGYQSLTTAHGFRSLALTAGQEVLGYDHEIIRRQLAHAIGDKIRQSYDRAKFLEERRAFMNDWSKALVEAGMEI